MGKGKIFIVIGLGYGDEGKGTITDFLSRQFKIQTVARYNGGAQAGHNVVTPEGKWHCFAQFGSGTFFAESKTFLSQEMFIEPANLLREGQALQEKGVRRPFSRLIIDPRASVITPFHKMIGQVKELAKGNSRYGSCGLGVGEAVYDRNAGGGLKVADLLNESDTELKRKIKKIIDEKSVLAEKIFKDSPSKEIRDTMAYFFKNYDADSLIMLYRHFIDNSEEITFLSSYLEQVLEIGSSVIFEGAQGALLDPFYGFVPYVTKTRSTALNSLTLMDCDSVADYQVKKIGVLRAYSTRHGAGPFVTEDPELNFPELHNSSDNPWQGKFRQGWFDPVAARYAIAANGGVDSIAITNLDQLSGRPEIKVCTSYFYEGSLDELDEYFEWAPLSRTTAEITAIKSSLDLANSQRTEIIKKCLPFDWIRFPGWDEDISRSRCWSDLPLQAQDYIDFLRDKLETPVSIVSVSPTYLGKIIADQ